MARAVEEEDFVLLFACRLIFARRFWNLRSTGSAWIRTPLRQALLDSPHLHLPVGHPNLLSHRLPELKLGSMHLLKDRDEVLELLLRDLFPLGPIPGEPIRGKIHRVSSILEVDEDDGTRDGCVGVVLGGRSR